MLHLESEDLFVDYGIRLPAAITHQQASFIAVELSNCFEEVKKIPAIRGIEFGDESGVDKY
jgi:hypothetical protein